MVGYRAKVATVLILLSAGCDPEVPRGVEELTPTPWPAPQAAERYDWKGTLVDQRFAGIDSDVAIMATGYPSVAYFAPAWDLIDLPDLPELPEGFPTPSPNHRAGEPEASPVIDWQLPEDWAPTPFYYLRYAWFTGINWMVETVAQVSHVRGLSLVQTRGGVPLIAFLDSDHDMGPEWCSAAYLSVAMRQPNGLWTIQRVVEPTTVVDGYCTPGLDCPVCEVVGLGPSMAEGSNGTVGIAYRRERYTADTLLNPDSDLEFLEAQVTATGLEVGPRAVVHAADGAGFFNSLQYGARPGGAVVPYIAYASFGEFESLPQGPFGVWLAQRNAAGTEWSKAEVQPELNWAVGPQLELKVDDGTLYLLLRALRADNTDLLADLILLSSSDGGDHFDLDPVVTDGRAGAHPSLAIDDDGRIGVTYYQCGTLYEGRCSPETDGLMFATKEASGWAIAPIEADPDLTDGEFTSLEFAGRTPVVAARNVTWLGPAGQQTLVVYLGSALDN